MDSLQGIPVEYKLDTFNMPRTGTTLCHPKIGYVNAMLLFRSRHLALNSPLDHFKGDQLTPLHQTHKNHGDPKDHFPPTAIWLSLNHGEHNPSHVRPSRLLINPFRLLTVSLLTTFPRVLQHKPKLHFPCCK